MENKDVFDARTTMLSPPEQTLQDSFSRKASGSSMDFVMSSLHPMPVVRGQPPLSPPISPETKNLNPESPSSIALRDPILFPHQDSSTQPPLFTSDPHRVIDEHVATRESSAFREVSPPHRVEYELALEFKSRVLEAYNQDRKRWARREFAQLREDNMLKHGGNRRTYLAIAPASGVRGNGIRGPRQPAVRSPKGIVKPARVKPAQARGATPESGKRVAREDKDFSALPDYCPPLSSLPNKPNSLKVDWKGAPIDLKFDPHAHLLHPDEIMLAANLRLDCATYLTSKRRIFIKRIEAFRIGKEFRKTDAQQACKIDVNKASKLWQAFDKVGWLNQKWIQKYL
ncbi:putative SWIRM domain-containing protein [Acephala macrosclerotiorum]|nr:putative SWIRM domain-containing protein [Acephala macrosclerotiorum]